MFFKSTHLGSHPEPLEVDDALKREVQVASARLEVVARTSQVVPRPC